MMLVGAQFAAKARMATRLGDQILQLAETVTEDEAQKAFDTCQKLGLVDGEGMLTAPEGLGDLSALRKAGLS
jgi:hypothetical protein